MKRLLSYNFTNINYGLKRVVAKAAAATWELWQDQEQLSRLTEHC